MQGFIRRRIPLFAAPRADDAARRWSCSALGLPATDSLVVSQVVLSFGIPFALVPLIMLTRRPDIMGALREPARSPRSWHAASRHDHRAERVPDLKQTFLG